MSEDEARGKRRRADEPAAASAAASAAAAAPAPDDLQAKIDYQKAGAYWDSVDATIDGVLGGFGHLTDVDLRDSHAFFQRQPSLAPRTPRPGTLACDCGAGIGRVAKGLLLDYCEKVDIVEQCKKYTDASWRFVGKERIREVLTVGLQVSLPSAPHPFPVPCPLRHAPCPLARANAAHSKPRLPGQDFNPPPATYDLVWVQWVIGAPTHRCCRAREPGLSTTLWHRAGHLPDDALVAFLGRCLAALKPGEHGRPRARSLATLRCSHTDMVAFSRRAAGHEGEQLQGQGQERP